VITQPVNNNQQFFALIESDGRRFIDLNTVIRLYADGTCTWVYLNSDQKILTTKNLGYYDKRLPKPIEQFHNSFFRIHHSHLINLSYIQKLNNKSKSLIIQTGETIPIAQRRFASFKKTLSHYKLY